MLEKLKNLKVVLRSKDILYFLQSVIGHRQLSVDDLKTICLHAPGHYVMDVDTLLSYCNCFDLVILGTYISLDKTILGLITDTSRLTKFLADKCFSKLFDEQILTADFFSFDIEEKKYMFKNEKLPLCWSSIRNLMIDFGFLNVERTIHSTRFFVSTKYEDIIQQYCKPHKKTITIEELRKRIEASNAAGEKAELFALDFEKQRIKSVVLQNQVRIISNIDVGAGYDIVSFDSESSSEYDRFIEVKAVSSDISFYLSSNEIEIARLKGPKYYLYLVDLSKICDDAYVPFMICDPASIIFNSKEWILEPQTYKVKHINTGIL
jgi:hypothetical protein